MKFDVLIVGAGPAGSTAAKFLSEKGLNVLLIDKKKFPRDKACGGGIPPKVLDRFDYIKKDWIESYSYNLITYSSTLKYKINFDKETPVLAMVLREKFDNGLVKLAIEKGTTFFDEKNVKDIEISKDKVKVFLDDGSVFESKIVIGADGVFSTIAKKTGLIQNKKNICMCIYEEYKFKKEILDEYFTEKRFCHNHVMLKGVGGYYWVFPKKEHLNIGITDFRQNKKTNKDFTNLRDLYKNYIKILKQEKIVPKNLEIIKLKGAAIPIKPLEKTYSNRIVLCGDAAGFASPATGEGIFYAMESGKIAADVIYESFEKNDFSEQFLKKYQNLWYKDFGKDLEMLSSFSYLWGENTEEILRLVSTDKKLANLVRDVISGEVSVNKYKWKMARRYLFVRIKDKFKRKK